MAVSLVCLSACMTQKTPTPNRCPIYRHYTKQEWSSLYDAINALPKTSPIIPVLQDYMDLLDKLKVCNDISLQ